MTTRFGVAPVTCARVLPQQPVRLCCCSWRRIRCNPRSHISDCLPTGCPPRHSPDAERLGTADNLDSDSCKHPHQPESLSPQHVFKERRHQYTPARGFDSHQLNWDVFLQPSPETSDLGEMRTHHEQQE